MIAHRTFPSYEDYVYKQGGKAIRKRDFLLAHLPKNTESFTRIFRDAAPHLKSGTVLCLGARTGAESLGAVKAGFKGSVGIDLHPVGPTVLPGDWHSLAFRCAVFANAYCNSFDHCLYPDQLTREVQRVLEPGGRFYVMATNRGGSASEWRADLGSNEALYWDTSDELRDALCSYGFQVQKEWRAGKWGHYVFGVKG